MARVTNFTSNGMPPIEIFHLDMAHGRCGASEVDYRGLYVDAGPTGVGGRLLSIKVEVYIK